MTQTRPAKVQGNSKRGLSVHQSFGDKRLRSGGQEHISDPINFERRNQPESGGRKTGKTLGLIDPKLEGNGKLWAEYGVQPTALL